jgi:hypothetical protein
LNLPSVYPLTLISYLTRQPAHCLLDHDEVLLAPLLSWLEVFRCDRQRRCRACRVVAAALSAQGAAPSRRHPSQSAAAAAAAAAATLGGSVTVRQATPMQLEALMQVLFQGMTIALAQTRPRPGPKAAVRNVAHGQKPD